MQLYLKKEIPAHVSYQQFCELFQCSFSPEYLQALFLQNNSDAVFEKCSGVLQKHCKTLQYNGCVFLARFSTRFLSGGTAFSVCFHRATFSKQVIFSSQVILPLHIFCKKLVSFSFGSFSSWKYNTNRNNM